MFKKVQELFEDVDLSSVIYGGSNCFSDEYYNDEILEDFALEIGAECASGVSKMVFFFEEFPDYVIKIPFKGTSSQDENYEVSIEEEFRGADRYFSIPNVHSWDYCETEARYYDLAVLDGVEDFFAGTFFLGTIQKHPVYYSERVENSLDNILWNDDALFADESSSKIAENLYREYGYNSTETYTFKNIISYMVEKYGEKRTDSFLHFLKTNHIQDFHDGNFGICSDGSIKIIDYSSWRG